jgi:hypothetical protein
MRLILIAFILFIRTIDNSNCQNIDDDTKSQIDTKIASSISECPKIDTLYSHGETITHKKKLGLFSLKTGKGAALKQTILCDSNLISQSISVTEFKKDRNNHSIYIYYFAENELVKYENFDFWRNKEDSKDNLMHKVVAYFNKGEIIKKELVINDKYEFDNDEIKQIVFYSDKIILENKKAIQLTKDITKGGL